MLYQKTVQVDHNSARLLCKLYICLSLTLSASFSVILKCNFSVENFFLFLIFLKANACRW